MNVLGIDPGNGKRGSLGVALFSSVYSRDSGPVTYTLDATATFKRRDLGHPWADLARQVLRWCEGRSTFTMLDRLVLEVPQVYGGGRGAGDPNDLIDILGAGALVAGFLQPATFVTYRPREWKGSIDGNDFIEQRIKPALSDFERAQAGHGPGECVVTSHEWDAAGLVLHDLGRLKPRKVFPR